VKGKQLGLVGGLLAGLALLAAAGALVWSRAGLAGPGAPGVGVRPMSAQEYERWARGQFLARYPDQKPLNWAIGRSAEEFRATKPMGKFVLHENDCSDFVGCVVDHALGAGARFERDSEQHALCGAGGALDWRLFVSRWLTDLDAVQPGDVVGMRHSPWYPPREESIGHVGVIGTDGYAYDFVKLKSWSEARYGRTKFEWFIRNNQPEEVVISRLRPEYRYRIIELRPAQ